MMGDAPVTGVVGGGATGAAGQESAPGPDGAPPDMRWWAPWALPVSAPPARDVIVEVRDGRIARLESGVSRERAAALPGTVLHDRCIVAPGFVDTHAHLEYAAWDALVDGLDFAGWIADHVARKRRLNPTHARASARLGALEALYGGITTVGDASFDGSAAHAMHDAGLRGRVYLEVFGDDGRAAVAIQQCRARLADLPSSRLLEHGISPHAPYTVGPALYRLVAETGLPWMTHLLESPAERPALRGEGPLARLLEASGIARPRWREAPIPALGSLLGPHVVAVHAVQASAGDLEVLAASGAALAHCPRSNARLGCGLLDLPAVERAGIRVGLGTDSPASAGALDMFAEMRSTLELHRAARGLDDAPDAACVLRMATMDAARALGYDRLGSLDVGAYADLVALETGAVADPTTAYVLGGSPADVRAVLVAGRDALAGDRTRLEDARAGVAEARTLLALPVGARRG